MGMGREGGPKPGPNPKPVDERFWAKVDIRGPDECWPWTASTDKQGYGCFNGAGEVKGPASRVAYILTYGTVPPGHHVHHDCDNPPCCNPRHLLLKTYKEHTMIHLHTHMRRKRA